MYVGLLTSLGGLAALVVGCLVPPLLHLLFRLISSSLDSGAVRADQSNIKRGGPGDAEYQALGRGDIHALHEHEQAQMRRFTVTRNELLDVGVCEMDYGVLQDTACCLSAVDMDMEEPRQGRPRTQVCKTRPSPVGGWASRGTKHTRNTHHTHFLNTLQ